MMKHPAKAIGMISGNCSSSSNLIINIWAKATPRWPVARGHSPLDNPGVVCAQIAVRQSIQQGSQKKDDVPDGQGFEPREDGLLPVVTLLEDFNEDEAFIPNIEWQLDFIKNSNVVTWLQDHPDWVYPDAAVSPRASKSLHVTKCVQSGASIQDALVATSSTSPD
eukprot:15353676-Ditylum_brightwellii.AAC.1